MTWEEKKFDGELVIWEVLEDGTKGAEIRLPIDMKHAVHRIVTEKMIEELGNVSRT